MRRRYKREKLEYTEYNVQDLSPKMKLMPFVLDQ